MMHTWRRTDGSYYDSAEAESEDDEPLPLRPSEIHEWTGRKWQWQGRGITHSVPRDDDVCAVAPERLRDILALLHETVEVQSYQGRTIEQMRLSVAGVATRMEAHLREAEPLMTTLADLQQFARLTKMLGRALAIVWRVLVWGTAAAGVLWALWHGDMVALKRALHVIAEP